MIFFYDLAIQLYLILVRIAAVRSTKARQWYQGQQGLLEKISAGLNPNHQYIWFHFASLGEFEQGRPVMEQLKKDYPDEKLFITFYSPSGYEIKKNNSLTEHTFYLPADTSRNARRLINLINPKIAVFTKYEYWYHYFKELNNRNVPLFMISANFSKSQSFFRWYGMLNREMLKFVSHFFVQNEISRVNLNELGYHNVTVAGDTRFDRVTQNAANPRKFNLVEEFCGNNLVFMGGSTWPEEEALIAGLITRYPNWKFIIAPHEIKEEKISNLEKILPAKSVRYSELKQNTGNEYPILIIDNIGMLSSLYQHADIAFIGGAFGSGLHNILEAAVFGIPVLFGPKHRRFHEAQELIDAGGGFSVADFTVLSKIMEYLLNENNRTNAGEAARQYVAENTGATPLIMHQIATTL
jgi:3-deoxy-D-manno-octulosonic-acid transferase